MKYWQFWLYYTKLLCFRICTVVNKSYGMIYGTAQNCKVGARASIVNVKCAHASIVNVKYVYVKFK